MNANEVGNGQKTPATCDFAELFKFPETQIQGIHDLFSRVCVCVNGLKMNGERLQFIIMNLHRAPAFAITKIDGSFDKCLSCLWTDLKDRDCAWLA